jgi:sugar phosphate permease
LVGFTAISSIMRDVYGVNNLAVSSLTLVFTLSVVPFSFPATRIIETQGIATPIRISSLLLIVGSWVRMLSPYSFYWILAGQVIISLVQPLVQTIGPKIAAIWFGDQERAIATTVTSIASVFGVLIGFALPIFFVNDDDKKDPEKARDKIQFYILVQSIIVTVLAIPILFLVKKQPETPPSKSARLFMKKRTKNLWTSIEKLLKNWNIWLLSISYS